MQFQYLKFILVIFVSLFLNETAMAVCTSSPCTAGVFQWPFSPFGGYKRDQYTFQLNTAANKYHAADDWNGVGGGNTDFGDSIYAIADGVVVDIDTIATPDSFGKSMRVRYLMPDGQQLDSVYMHLKDILIAANSVVFAGQKIATLGDSNGFYAGSAHLHWEVRKDLMFPLRQNPYYNPIAVSTAVKYTSPSVLVDDRASGGFSLQLAVGNFTQFAVGQVTPAALIYVQDQFGLRYSIKRAADAGIIAWWGITWLGVDGVWYYNPDLMKVVLTPGVQYRITAQSPSLGLNVMYSGNHFKADRSRVDIIRAASQDLRFKNVLAETYGEDLSWDPSWELRWMGLTFLNNNGTTWNVYIQHTTHKTNPFIRWTNYFDPNIGQWTPWKEVGVDVLY